jgi:hypothetical protein
VWGGIPDILCRAKYVRIDAAAVRSHDPYTPQTLPLRKGGWGVSIDCIQKVSITVVQRNHDVGAREGCA